MYIKIKNLLKDQDFSELIKGSGISFALRISGLIIGYLLTILIAQLFGASGLGSYILAITVLRLFTLVAKLGVDTSSIRFIASYASQRKWSSIFNFRKRIFYLLCVTSLISSLVMYFFASEIANLVNTQEFYIKINAFFIVPMVFFMLNYQSLRGLKKIAEFSFFYRVSQSLFSIICILIIYQFIKEDVVPLYAYLISLFIVSFLSFLSFRYWLKEMSHGEHEAQVEIMSYSSIIKISLPLMFAQSVQFIMAWTDKLMLGGMINDEAVGIYHAAFKLSMFSAIALMSVNSIASPKLAEKFANQDIHGLRKITNQSTRIIFFCTIPLIIVSFLFPEFLLSTFGKEDFTLGVFAFLALSIGRLISACSGPVGNILQMTNNQNIYGKILFIGALINVLLNLFLIPESNPFSVYGISGINGAAIASMSSLIFWNLSMIFVVKKKFGFYTFYIPFLKK